MIIMLLGFFEHGNACFRKIRRTIPRILHKQNPTHMHTCTQKEKRKTNKQMKEEEKIDFLP
jgi:hypothetical protein